MADADWAKYKQLRGKTLPPTVIFRDTTYELQQLFKRDFYAATGLYRASTTTEGIETPSQMVVKIYHTEPLGVLPLRWLGRMLANREIYFYECAGDIKGLPEFYGRLGESGFVREYIPGCHLREYRRVHQPDRKFYARVHTILAQLHLLGIAHNDLSKAENILVRPDGTPVLIDLQIALRLQLRFPLLRTIANRIVRYLQSVDCYHIGKHHRKDRPEDFTVEELAQSRRKGILLTLHAWLLRKPYRGVRHFVLGRFMKVNSNAGGTESSRSKSELPPARAA